MTMNQQDCIHYHRVLDRRAPVVATLGPFMAQGTTERTARAELLEMVATTLANRTMGDRPVVFAADNDRLIVAWRDITGNWEYTFVRPGPDGQYAYGSGGSFGPDDSDLGSIRAWASTLREDAKDGAR